MATLVAHVSLEVGERWEVEVPIDEVCTHSVTTFARAVSCSRNIIADVKKWHDPGGLDAFVLNECLLQSKVRPVVVESTAPV
ncbi:MAG: hypothetical protein J07HQX50_01012 [Haloquadratum sp. J07HQX50]|nr:MAG: hypothetical protein J07HQX50_01012 [Haloquadratum sp. J07HQX50]